MSNRAAAVTLILSIMVAFAAGGIVSATGPVERPFCNVAGAWPAGDTLTRGQWYTIDCTGDVDVALVVMDLQGDNDPDGFQNTCVDVAGECGDQKFFVPTVIDAGTYHLTAILVPCSECPEERMALKVFEVE